MRVLQLLKFSAVFFFILIYMLISSIIWLLPFVGEWTKRKACQQIHSRFCRLGLFLLDVKVKSSFRSPLSQEQAFLMVGNHLSYMDILIIAAERPTCFVTSNEIKEVPFLGHLCRLAGCLFIERRNKTNLLKEIREITEALERGLNVAVFPEATSTNGEQILRFRKPLFAASIASGKPVLPFCLNYHHIDSEPVTLFNRDLLFWYGDMSFAPHLWNFAGLKNIHVDLEMLSPIETHSDDHVEGLALLSQRRVESAFRPVQGILHSEIL